MLERSTVKSSLEVYQTIEEENNQVSEFPYREAVGGLM